MSEDTKAKSETKQEPEKKTAPTTAKTIHLVEFLNEQSSLSKIMKDYAKDYLKRKVGLVGTSDQYKEALNELMNRKQ